MTLGMTGKICSGKNRLADIFERRGWQVIDVDLVGHEVIEESVKPLRSLFGDLIVTAEGRVDRKALGSEVFDAPDRLAMLETVVHPRMVERCRELIEARDERSHPRGTVLNAAVLQRMGLHRLCDAVIFVRAPLLKRMYRAVISRGMSVGDFLARNRAQRSISPTLFYDEMPIYVIINNHGDRWLERQVTELTAALGFGRE